MKPITSLLMYWQVTDQRKGLCLANTLHGVGRKNRKYLKDLYNKKQLPLHNRQTDEQAILVCISALRDRKQIEERKFQDKYKINDE